MTRSCTDPESLNLTTLTKRFVSTWKTLVGSPCRAPEDSGRRCSRSQDPCRRRLPSMLGEIGHQRPQVELHDLDDRLAGLDSCKSRMSLTSRSRRWPDRSIEPSSSPAPGPGRCPRAVHWPPARWSGASSARGSRWPGTRTWPYSPARPPRERSRGHVASVGGSDVLGHPRTCPPPDHRPRWANEVTRSSIASPSPLRTVVSKSRARRPEMSSRRSSEYAACGQQRRHGDLVESRSSLLLDQPVNASKS